MTQYIVITQTIIGLFFLIDDGLIELTLFISPPVANNLCTILHKKLFHPAFTKVLFLIKSSLVPPAKKSFILVLVMLFYLLPLSYHTHCSCYHRCNIAKICRQDHRICSLCKVAELLHQFFRYAQLNGLHSPL